MEELKKGEFNWHERINANTNETESLLAGKVSKTGDSMTGPLSLPELLTFMKGGGVGDKNYALWKLYDLNPVNWAGIGADGSGNAWIRAGLTDEQSSTLFVGSYTKEVYFNGSPMWHTGNLPVESGTWTPTIIGSVATGTYNGIPIRGIYQRIGKLCNIYCYMGINSFAGFAGNLMIVGLPFTSASESGFSWGTNSFQKMDTTIIMTGSGTAIWFYKKNSIIPIDATEVNTIGYMVFSGSYFLA